MTSPPRRVTLAPPQEQTVEIEIDDRVFIARSLTRTAQQRVDQAEQSLGDAQTMDDVVRATIGILDAMVEPTAGQRKTISELLTPMWEADKITASQVSKLLEDIGEAAQARPT